MKTNHALVAAPFLLILGAISGREIFAKDQPISPPGPSSLSTRGERKVIRVQRPVKDDSIVSPTDLQGLLDLVDPQAPFETSTRLRAALGDLEPGALENLIHQLNEDYQSHPGFSTLRYSLLNHLVSKDPFHALDMILAHEDAAFRSSSIAIIMKGAARFDLDAAKETLGIIQDKYLKQLARHAISNATMGSPDSSNEDLLALLNEEPSPVYHQYNLGFNPWMEYPSFGGNFINYQVNAIGALGSLAKKDLAAAESYALGLKTQGERNNALIQIASSLAQEDPALALEWARNAEAGQGRDQSIATVLATLSTSDPVKASSLLNEINNLQQRNGAISTIAANWAKIDPNAAIAWLDALPGSGARSNAYSSVAYQISQTDPRAALDLAEKIPGTSRTNTLSQILSQWINKDFDAAHNWATSQTDPFTRQTAISQLINPWARKDPAAVAAFLEESISETPSSTLQSHIGTVARQWAIKDQAAALNWSSRLENEKLRRTAQGGIYQSWANSAPAEAASHLATLTQKEDRQPLLNALAGSWANRDPEAAQNWLGTLPAADRFEAAGSAISSLSSSQPQLAANLFDRLITDAGSNEDQLRKINQQAGRIAGSWSAHAPGEAAQWAAGILSDNEQAAAYGSIASNWAQHDLPAAAEWIDALPVGKPRDSATDYLVQNIQQIDPAAAFDWADTISDDSSRYNSVRNVLNQWKQSDPEGARQAAASANISEEDRERLLQQLK